MNIDIVRQSLQERWPNIDFDHLPEHDYSVLDDDDEREFLGIARLPVEDLQKVLHSLENSELIIALSSSPSDFQERVFTAAGDYGAYLREEVEFFENRQSREEIESGYRNTGETYPEELAERDIREQELTARRAKRSLLKAVRELADKGEIEPPVASSGEQLQASERSVDPRSKALESFTDRMLLNLGAHVDTEALHVCLSTASPEVRERFLILWPEAHQAVERFYDLEVVDRSWGQLRVEIEKEAEALIKSAPEVADTPQSQPRKRRKKCGGGKRRTRTIDKRRRFLLGALLGVIVIAAIGAVALIDDGEPFDDDQPALRDGTEQRSKISSGEVRELLPGASLSTGEGAGVTLEFFSSANERLARTRVEPQSRVARSASAPARESEQDTLTLYVGRVRVHVEREGFVLRTRMVELVGESGSRFLVSAKLDGTTDVMGESGAVLARSLRPNAEGTRTIMDGDRVRFED